MIWDNIVQVLFRRINKPINKTNIQPVAAVRRTVEKLQKKYIVPESRISRDKEISLSDLEGHITKFVMCEKEFDAICFACPKCQSGHWCIIPYGNEQIMAKKIGGGKMPIWKKINGESIDDITVSPSFNIVPGCGLHGYVINGKWKWC